jgi:hypothetical protein
MLGKYQTYSPLLLVCAAMQTEKFLNGLSKVTDFLDVIDTIWGITETFGEQAMASCAAVVMNSVGHVGMCKAVLSGMLSV